MVTTGVLSLSNFCTTGGRGVRRANFLPRLLTRSRTSCAADSRLRSSLKVAMTNEVPCPENRTQLVDAVDGVDDFFDLLRDEGFNFPAARRRAGWCGRLTVGRSTEGKRSTPNRKKLAAPTTTNDKHDHAPRRPDGGYRFRRVSALRNLDTATIWSAATCRRFASVAA